MTELTSILQQQFGLDAFRPGQERIVRGLLAGRDVLAVLPTGAGKSLPYQLAAQLLPGLTVVVTPLLALMHDQVESLEERGLAVEAVSGSQSGGELAERGLLYVTPERFDNDEFMAQLGQRQVSLFVVDEAHSISQWGHSFRPAYLGLSAAIARLGRPTVLALTATATPWVRADIVERLGLRQPDLVVHGVDRPNLFLQVERVEAEHQDRRALRRLLLDEPAEEMRGSGIVYAATVRGAEEAAAWLREWGIAADAYHGRRRKADRERIQAAFMAGELRVLAATNAFGLGVDKPDVRFVVHRDVPANLESYYQEAGRAGRDGQPARCCLIYRPGDLGRAAFLGAAGELTRDEVAQAHTGLVRQRAGSLRQLQRASGLSRGDLVRLVEILCDHGILEERRGRLRLRVPDFDPEQVPLEGEQRRRAYERSRLEMMRGYAELRDCRRRYILNYFGEEPAAERCGRCDNDEGHAALPEPSKVPLAVADRVRHPGWGDGVVERVAGDTVTVLFDRAGYKTLAADLVLEQHLLERL